MTVPIYKGRKINKILCLSFLGITLITLSAAGVCTALDRSALCQTFCILALITGAFCLVYGVLWLIYGRKEGKMEKALNELLSRQYMPEDPARPDYRENTYGYYKTIQAKEKPVSFHSSCFVRFAHFRRRSVFLCVCG